MSVRQIYERKNVAFTWNVKWEENLDGIWKFEIANNSRILVVQ